VFHRSSDSLKSGGRLPHDGTSGDLLPGRPWLAAIPWAAYLACSWTWCIGMFLPILLVRDFGLGGYIAFAVPNVVGAAAMGWVLLRRESSISMVRRHAAFASIFSVVTIAFHAFFLVWLASGLWLFPWPMGIAGVLLVILMTMVVASLRAAWQAVLALLLVLATAATYIVASSRGILPPGPAGELGEAITLNRLPPAHLAMFLGVSIFGFALCPYLDLTFHRARSALPQAPARLAFSLGFGVFFLGMILLTLVYSGLFLGRGSAWPHLVALHIFVQSAFTIGVHARALSSPLLPREIRGGCLVAAIGGAILVLIVSLFLMRGFEPITELHLLHANGMGTGETIYRVFMGFYGLVFPAYVWLCVIPGRGGATGPSRTHLRVVAAVVGFTAPMFYMAFIAHLTWWILPALIVVLAAKLLIPAPGPPLQRNA
jgi:hypothetical protein